MRPPLPLPPPVDRIRQRARLLRRFFQGAFAACEWCLTLVLIGLVVVLLFVEGTTLPDAWIKQSTLSLRILDREGRFLHEVPARNGRFGAWLPHGRIPEAVKKATLAAEDHRLFHHPGVDPIAILRALVSNVRHGRKVSGASTLAMQVVRQWSPGKRTYKNKLKEMFWALVLQRRLGPVGVLREYVNRAPYGNRVQGVQRASLLYFDKPASDLSLAEAAFLAALPWGPGILNPYHARGKRRAVKRAHFILGRALRLGLIKPTEYHEALRDPVILQKKKSRSALAVHWTERVGNAWRRSRAGSLRKVTTLRTTLDLPLQRVATRALRRTLSRLRGRNAGTGAVVVLDHRSGEVLAYVGSHDYFDRGARGALDYLQAKRSPGSTLKPFVYGMAMEKRKKTGASLYSDLAVSYFWSRGHYRPRNYDDRYLGPLRLRAALGNSRNIPAIKALVQVGVPPMLARLRKLGLELPGAPSRYGLGLALGNGGVRLVRLVRSYAALARQGKAISLKWARTARGSLGERIPVSQILDRVVAPASARGEVLSPAVASVLSDILADPMARLPAFPQFSRFALPFKVAVKTGTSQGFRDAWMVGYSDRVVVGCWIGNHDRRRMKRVTGAGGCGGVFAEVIKAAMKRTKRTRPATFVSPSGWKKETVCALSGAAATRHCRATVEEWLPAHRRSRACRFHKALRVDRRNGLRAGARCSKAHVRERVFLSLPPEYSSWSKMMGLPRPPHKQSPLCGGAAPAARKKPTLRIAHPPDNARFLVDPSTPREFSTVGLRIRATAPLKRVLWFANGRLVGSTRWPHQFRWSLRKGSWEFIATTADRLVRSRPIRVKVY